MSIASVPSSANVTHEESNVEITPIMSYLADGLDELLSQAGMKKTTSVEFLEGIMAVTFNKSLARPIGIDELIKSLKVIFDVNREKVDKYFKFAGISREDFFTTDLLSAYKNAIIGYGINSARKSSVRIGVEDEDVEQKLQLESNPGIVNYIRAFLNLKLKDEGANVAVEIAKLLDDGATLNLSDQFVKAIIVYIESQVAQKISELTEAAAKARLENFFQEIVDRMMELINKMLRQADPQEAQSLNVAVLVDELSSLDAQYKFAPAIGFLARTLALEYNSNDLDGADSKVVNFRRAVTGVQQEVRLPLIDMFAPFDGKSAELFRSGPHQRDNLELQWRMRGLPPRVSPKHPKAGPSQQQSRKLYRGPSYKVGPDGRQIGPPFGTYFSATKGKYSVLIKKKLK